MIGLDTNVLARYLLDDDAQHSIAVRRVITQARRNGETLMICTPAFLELEWVLRSRPGSNKVLVIGALRMLLEAKGLEIDDEASVEQALHTYENASVDFAECLFHSIYTRKGCSAMFTFDKAAQKQLPGAVAPS